MGVTNRDASLNTQKRRGAAVNSYFQGWSNATVNSSNANHALKAPAATSAEVVSQIYTGGVVENTLNNQIARVNGLTNDGNTALYPDNRSAGGAGGLTGSS